jgi:hypothetical protein
MRYSFRYGRLGRDALRGVQATGDPGEVQFTQSKILRRDLVATGGTGYLQFRSAVIPDVSGPITVSFEEVR